MKVKKLMNYVKEMIQKTICVESTTTNISSLILLEKKNIFIMKMIRWPEILKLRTLMRNVL